MPTIQTVSVFLLLSGSAWAQQAASAAAPPPPNDLTKASYMSAADVAAGVAQLGNTRADIAFRVFHIPPYTINAAHRAPVPNIASLHEAQAELFIVMEGTATMVTGGKIVEGTRNGTNITGTSIAGGTSQKLSKGDFLIVPAGVPHWFTNIAPTGISLTQMYLPKSN
jgi:mannose-6-phosphate isomerase-like protein (cupin superfamily)